MRRVLLLVTVAAMMVSTLGANALPASADRFAGDIPPHRHFIDTPGSDGTLTVGPDVCANPQTQEGFDQFHLNLHRGTSSSTAVPSTHAFAQENNPVNGVSATSC